MDQKVATIIWRRVRLGSLNRLLNPVLIIAYIEILQTIIPEIKPARTNKGTGVSPSKKDKMAIENHMIYDANAMRNLLILKVCWRSSLRNIVNVNHLLNSREVTGYFHFYLIIKSLHEFIK